MPLTIERKKRAFQEALSFSGFVGAMQVNQDKLLANYVAYQLSIEDKAFFAKLPEAVEVLVLAHDWCGDVAANLPLFGKIEVETRKLKLHILLRDPDNQDIAEAYLHPDGRNHIPTYIFYNQQGEELGVFIERPDGITAQIIGWKDNFYATHPEFEGQGKPLSELTPEVKTALLAYLKQQRDGVRAQEQVAILGIIKNFAGQVANSLS